MSNELSYTIEEVAKLLKVSKLTVYDLVKKGDLPVFRVGRQMRMTASDLNDYIQSQTARPTPSISAAEPIAKPIVISGQDMVLDILSNHIEENLQQKTLRSYSGSLNSLIAMYNGECDVVSLHMFDGDTGEYNLPFTKKILVGHPHIVIRLLSRRAGFYVQKGNPQKLSSWEDLANAELRLVNREKGSGARILLDEQLRLHHIPSRTINGYDHEESSHLSVASAVASHSADVGIGIEKAATMVGIDFIPLINECYDLVILKNAQNRALIEYVTELLCTSSFQSKIKALGNYDVSEMGTIVYESH
ncbi:helix-turn-helix transcriptional regulator [Priestia koreensis]|uniref:Molybdopterin biosynthesis protein n=1 Tax=Priestia koreensis TaxID=284581 RepID=A0A0M0KZN2_9BACI|nr:helix-turn-helix transcriptional regulator [Priestia koreensis]KOO44269.1 hypothetical protein AMD01_13355 [Priestia koreensis]